MERGTVLRDANAGDGLIYVGGSQKKFSLERHWRSGVPPTSGMTVNVSLKDDGEIEWVTKVEDSQLAKEQAAVVFDKGWKILSLVLIKGSQLSRKLTERVGAGTLFSVVALVITWNWLYTLSSLGYSFSFHDMQAVLNGSASLQRIFSDYNPGAGIYGLLFWISLLLPIAYSFYPKRYLTLGYMAPLGYGILYWILLFIKSAKDPMIGDVIIGAASFASFQSGFYLSIPFAVYLAFIGAKKFMSHK